MSQIIRQLGAVAVIAIATASLVRADDDEGRRERDAYVVTPLVSNLAGHAAARDPVLQNAWGIAFSPAGSPFWVNDNATGARRFMTAPARKLRHCRYPSRYRATLCRRRPAKPTTLAIIQSHSGRPDGHRMESIGCIPRPWHHDSGGLHLLDGGRHDLGVGGRVEPGR